MMEFRETLRTENILASEAVQRLQKLDVTLTSGSQDIEKNHSSMELVNMCFKTASKVNVICQEQNYG